MTRVLLLLALSFPAAASAGRIDAEQLRDRMNDAFVEHGLRMQVGPWSRNAPGSLALTALVTRNIRLVAQQSWAGEVSSVVLVMQSAGTYDSTLELVGTIAAMTFAAHPDLTLDERNQLFADLGLFSDAWGMRGLDGEAEHDGVHWRILHPASDALTVLVVSWDAGTTPRSTSLRGVQAT